MYPTVYKITIANATGAAPANGFVDNTTIEQYMAAGSSPTTYAQCQAKERANIRFSMLCQQLGLEANVYVTDMVATSASATAEAAPFVIHATIERGDGVLSTRDESNAGATLTGTAALKRWAARALIEARTLNAAIVDPTLTGAPGNATTAMRVGVRTESLVVGAVAANLTAAEALITVVAL